MSTSADSHRSGIWVAAATFVVWGLTPLYWHLLKTVPSLQIVAHRVVWSAVLVVAWLAWKQGRGWLRAGLARPRAAWMLSLSTVLIGFNWSLYIWAVNAGHVIETSLGYFINPLLNVVLGVLFLRERLSAWQWLSVGIAALGVLWLTVNHGGLPWIALLLALSFGLYGLLRKLLAIDAVSGQGIENMFLFLPALALLAWGETNGSGGFFDGWGWYLDTLLILGGVVSALPLIGFAYAVRRVPLSVVGLMQYIAPTLQFLIGALVFHEAFDRDRAIGFVFIWVALAIFVLDSVWRTRRQATPAVDVVAAEV